MKTGYSIRTWRMRLFCPQPIWLDRTEEYFQNVVEFYYDLLQKHEELWNDSLFDIQRSLELLTVAGRDGREPVNPLPMGKVPVYLRRAAINKASATVKSILGKAEEPNSRKAVSQKAQEKPQVKPKKTPKEATKETPQRISQKTSPEEQEHSLEFPDTVESKVTFFKGMYSDLTDESIRLKLWNGEKWVWTDCRLKGRSFPADSQLMSPTLVKEEKFYMLNIPVKQENSDARTAKERMAAGTRLCSVRFTNTDTFAMSCILDEKGSQVAVYASKGGREYGHRCKLLMEKIQRSRKNTDNDNCPQPNRKYYMHLKNLSEHYAHQVSRQIVDFCKKNQAGILVLPEYDSNYSKMVMIKSGNFSPLHLSSRIRSYLQYKAWAEGMLVLEARTDGLKDKCSVCGGKIRRKGNEFICENGHQGNRFLNDARNLGRKCQASFYKSR